MMRVYCMHYSSSKLSGEQVPYRANRKALGKITKEMVNNYFPVDLRERRTGITS